MLYRAQAKLYKGQNSCWREVDSPQAKLCKGQDSCRERVYSPGAELMSDHASDGSREHITKPLEPYIKRKQQTLVVDNHITQATRRKQITKLESQLKDMLLHAEPEIMSEMRIYNIGTKDWHTWLITVQYRKRIAACGSVVHLNMPWSDWRRQGEPDDFSSRRAPVA